MEEVEAKLSPTDLSSKDEDCCRSAGRKANKVVSLQVKTSQKSTQAVRKAQNACPAISPMDCIRTPASIQELYQDHI